MTAMESDRRSGPDRRKLPRGGRRPGDADGFAPLVLVADEDVESSGRCEAILAGLRFAVAPARSVDEALKVMEALRPNLIVAHLKDESRLRAAMAAQGRDERRADHQRHSRNQRADRAHRGHPSAPPPTRRPWRVTRAAGLTIIALLLLSRLPPTAQVPTALSLREAIARALEANRTLLASRRARAVGLAERDVAGQRPNPEVASRPSAKRRTGRSPEHCRSSCTASGSDGLTSRRRRWRCRTPRSRGRPRTS